MLDVMGEYEARFSGRPDVSTFLIGPENERIVAKTLRDALERGTPLTFKEVHQLEQRIAPRPGAIR